VKESVVYFLFDRVRGEWFRVTDEQLELIRDACEEHERSEMVDRLERSLKLIRAQQSNCIDTS
jgi:hypothetical protein